MWALLGCSTLLRRMFPTPSVEEGVEMLIKRARWLQNAPPRLLPAQPLPSPSCLKPRCQNTAFVLQSSSQTGCIEAAHAESSLEERGSNPESIENSTLAHQHTRALCQGRADSINGHAAFSCHSTDVLMTIGCRAISVSQHISPGGATGKIHYCIRISPRYVIFYR